MADTRSVDILIDSVVDVKAHKIIVQVLKLKCETEE